MGRFSENPFVWTNDNIIDVSKSVYLCFTRLSSCIDLYWPKSQQCQLPSCMNNLCSIGLDIVFVIFTLIPMVVKTCLSSVFYILVQFKTGIFELTYGHICYIHTSHNHALILYGLLNFLITDTTWSHSLHRNTFSSRIVSWCWSNPLKLFKCAGHMFHGNIRVFFLQLTALGRFLSFL